MSDELTLKEVQEYIGDTESILEDYGVDPDEFAAENKLSIVVPADNELQLDIDSPKIENLNRYEQVLEILNQFNKIKSSKNTKSKSGNLHVTLTLDHAVSAVERVLLQACLGSDPIREILTYKNILDGSDRPQFLFEKEANA